MNEHPPGTNPETCAVCREPKALGNCDFGKGNPHLLATPHCRACCTNPERDNWRALEEVEGAARAGEGLVRRILRRYASAYSRFLGRITTLGCARVIRTPSSGF